IELAATRVTLLSPARILEQVQGNRLDFLTTKRRDAESRQKTLRATLDWSYRLLSEPARVFLISLSVFRGGWTLEAAKAVCVDCGGLKVEGKGGESSTLDTQQLALNSEPSPHHLITLSPHQSTPDALELVTQLRDSSLIEVVDTQEGLRFTLLETI